MLHTLIKIVKLLLKPNSVKKFITKLDVSVLEYKITGLPLVYLKKKFARFQISSRFLKVDIFGSIFNSKLFKVRNCVK